MARQSTPVADTEVAATASEIAKTNGEAKKDDRVVVSLPSDLGPLLDKAGEEMSKVVKEQAGIELRLTRAKVVESLIRTHVKP